jgi:hypothetical protein
MSGGTSLLRVCAYLDAVATQPPSIMTPAPHHRNQNQAKSGGAGGGVRRFFFSSSWVDNLTHGGHMAVALSGTDGWGLLVKVDGTDCRSIGLPCRYAVGLDGTELSKLLYYIPRPATSLRSGV